MFFLSAGIFAESKSFYSNASKETQALIKKADGLVAKGQYCSALSCFENIPDNEYTIYKKNEILIENYIQTEDFVKFYLKDLKKGETLDELRVNCTQELTAYDFDAEKIIIEYESNNGSSFVLNLALANYYYSFLSCYGSYLGDYAEDLTEAIYQNYVSAFENGCFDNKSLYYYGCFLTENKRYADAEKVFASLTELDKKNESVWYGYAIALYYQGKFETAADSVKTSIKLSSNLKDNAYILNKNVLLADIYFNDGKYSEAENVLIKAMKKYPQSEYLLPFLGEIYLLQGKTEN
ncbi:MAG: tetratricopeptide repeat protein, partial [Spirochaetales bacterium]|nr:tetratricopeptide repeat protein [Spirochaetales bacterium]